MYSDIYICILGYKNSPVSRMATEKTMIWVYPKYKSKLKKEAADKEMSILQYTQLLSEGKICNKKKFDFDFRL